jgi:hypothetical protein
MAGCSFVLSFCHELLELDEFVIFFAEDKKDETPAYSMVTAFCRMTALFMINRRSY